MEEAHSAPDRGVDVVESLTCAEEAVLERAVAKLVLLGEQVGVDASLMIALLESGMSVVDLVEYMASRKRQCRCD